MSDLISIIRRVKREMNIEDKDISVENELLTFNKGGQKYYFNEKVIFYTDSDGLNKCYDCSSRIVNDSKAYYNNKGIIDIGLNYHCPKCNPEEVPKVSYDNRRYRGGFKIKI